MTDTNKTACYYALVANGFIQMNLDTGQLEIYERRQDAETFRKGKQEIVKINVSKDENKAQ